MNLHSKKYWFIAFLCVTLSLTFESVDVHGQEASVANDDVITVSNVENLKLQYIFDGYCNGISPNSRYVAVRYSLEGYGYHDIYDLESGESLRTLETRASNIQFSLNENWLKILRISGGFVNILTGQVIDVPGHYSPKAHYWIPTDDPKTIYDLADGQPISLQMNSGQDILTFMPYDRPVLLSREGWLKDALTQEIITTLHYPQGAIIAREAVFDSTGSLIVVAGGGGISGVYTVANGKQLFAIDRAYPTAYDPWVEFSPDNTYIWVAGNGVYEIQTGERLFETEGTSALFSPDGGLIAVKDDGLYDLTTGIKRFAVSGPLEFSPDGLLLEVFDSLYDVRTGEKLGFNFGVEYSYDGGLYAVSLKGVFESATGKLIMKTPNGSVQGFSRDERLVAVDNGAYSHSGLYDTYTGMFQLEIPQYSSAFSPDGTKYVVSFNSNLCGVFTISEDVPRGVIFIAKGVNIRRSPSFDGRFIRSSKENESVFVYARTPDSNWFCIGDHQWVSASVARQIYIPEALPVETG